MWKLLCVCCLVRCREGVCFWVLWLGFEKLGDVGILIL